MEKNDLSIMDVPEVRAKAAEVLAGYASNPEMKVELFPDILKAAYEAIKTLYIETIPVL
jgi:hypothetical protein